MIRSFIGISLLLLTVGCRFDTSGVAVPPADRALTEGGSHDGARPVLDRTPESVRLDAAADRLDAAADRSTVHAEVSTADRAKDSPTPDLATQDLAGPAEPKPDQPKPDQPKPDQPKPDQPKPDQPKPDQPKLDQPKPDQPKPDQPKPDQPKPDQPPITAPPCASGSPVFTFQANMVICSGASLTQCSASATCNAAGGWHLCTATEYVARGGKTILPPSSSAWLASCVRSGGTPHAPTNSVCGSCGSASTSSAAVSWTCDQSVTFTRNDSYVAVGTKNGCRRVGVNVLANEANWAIGASNMTFAYSTCCK